jgi:hypothetical protein
MNAHPGRIWNTVRRYVSSPRMLLGGLALACLSGTVLAADYVPGVAVVPEVRTPTGELRTYRTGLGYSYWRSSC